MNLVVHKLRDYQVECLQESLKAFNGSINRACVSLPVGSGKTAIFASLIPLVDPINSRASKTLVLAHRQELLVQAFNQISRFAPELKVGLELGAKRPDWDVDVVVASVPTLGRLNSSKLLEYDINAYKLVIIDEAHHASASTYQRILNHFKVYDPDSSIKVWGCSATIRRHDGISLSPTFEKIVYQRTVQEMIDDGWLCDIQVNTVKTSIDLNGLPVTKSDFNISKLAEVVNVESRNNIVLKTYLEQCKAHSRSSTLVFACDRAHILSLVDLFRLNGIDAHGIDSKSSPGDRESLIERFKNREIPVLVNCGIVTEGVDIPVVDMLLLARPTKSAVLLQQMLGRGMRLYPGKEYCLVLDFVDVVDDQMMIATVPTLLGLDPNAILKEQGIKSSRTLQSSISEIEDQGVDSSSHIITLIPFRNPFGMKEIDADAGYIRSHSSLHWVRVGESRWILQIAGSTSNQYIVLEKESNIWKGTHKKVQKKSLKVYHRTISGDPALLMKHDNFISAVKSLDHYVKSKFGYVTAKLVSTFAPWRKVAASQSQLSFLRKMGIEVDENLTKGHAADLIVRKFYGGAGAAKKEIAVSRKLEKTKKASIGW